VEFFFYHEADEHTSYADIRQATEALEPNPHDSHFAELDCGTCHRMHGPSEDSCAQCHVWRWEVP
jgi:hypothetical protein